MSTVARATIYWKTPPEVPGETDKSPAHLRSWVIPGRAWRPAGNLSWRQACAGQTEDQGPLRCVSEILASGAVRAGLCLCLPAWLNSRGWNLRVPPAGGWRGRAGRPAQSALSGTPAWPTCPGSQRAVWIGSPVEALWGPRAVGKRSRVASFPLRGSGVPAWKKGHLSCF